MSGVSRNVVLDKGNFSRERPVTKALNDYIPLHASPAARNYFHPDPSFFRILSLVIDCVIVNVVARVGP